MLSVKENPQIITEELTQNIVENKLPYSCASCTKTFKTNRKLTVHERTHTGEKPYSCIYCNKTFSQQGNMKRHEKIHTGEKSIDMKVRTENDSSSEKPLIKENENFDEALESGAKKNYHRYTLEFKLKVINHAKKSGNRRQTARENNISDSLVKNWESKEGLLIEALSKVPYACIECQMTFHRSKDLKVHEQLTHLSVNVCPKSKSENDGVKSDDMKVGKENVSSSEKPQIITNGGKSIDMKVRTENDSNSEKPLIKENENSDEKMSHSIKSKAQRDSIAKRLHQNLAKNPNEPLIKVNENCDHKISDSLKLKLKNRIQSKEKGIKTAHDSVVEIKDRAKSQTITEELTQNVVKNKLAYSCKYRTCTKTFMTNQKLIVHVRTHKGEKPYSCKYCNKTFSQQENMKEHEKTHTEEKPCRSKKKMPLMNSITNGGKSIDMKVRTENDSNSEKPVAVVETKDCSKKPLIEEKENSDGKMSDSKKYQQEIKTRNLYCGYCPRRFKSNHHLQNHERFGHKGEKPKKTFFCKTCNFRSASKYSLKKHELNHTKEKPKIVTNQQNYDDKMPHSCEYCGQKFESNDALIFHVRCKHIV